MVAVDRGRNAASGPQGESSADAASEPPPIQGRARCRASRCSSPRHLRVLYIGRDVRCAESWDVAALLNRVLERLLIEARLSRRPALDTPRGQGGADDGPARPGASPRAGRRGLGVTRQEGRAGTHDSVSAEGAVGERRSGSPNPRLLYAANINSLKRRPHQRRGPRTSLTSQLLLTGWGRSKG